MPRALLPAGLAAVDRRIVTLADTAVALGSGQLDVLATPRMLAWMEATTCSALAPYLDAGETSVGTRIELEHMQASAVGAEITFEATLQHVDGRLVRFEVVALDHDGRLLGRAEITRVIVDEARFLSRL